MTTNNKINVLIVDDSALMRRMVTDILNKHPYINVVDYAINGKIALEKLEKLSPDIIILDVEMPVMNGLETLTNIMKTKPRPVIMFSSLTKEGADVTLKALELGAIDFMQKPEGDFSLKTVEKNLVEKVLLAYETSKANGYNNLLVNKAPSFSTQQYTIKKSSNKVKTVIIGASTGGPKALKDVVPYLPADLPAKILIVQHMPPTFTATLAARLDQASKVKVKEAAEGDKLEVGHAYLAPGGFHMGINADETIFLDDKTPTILGVRPAIDYTFESAAKIFGKDIICVILTGMGHDGTRGAGIIKKAGGYCIAEDESTSIIYGMPKSVYVAGHVDEAVPLYNVAESIVKAVYR